MATSEELLAGASAGSATVGIGCGPDGGAVRRSASAFGGCVKVYTDPAALASDLASGRIDAAVRGDMPSSVLLPLVRDRLGLDHLERAVLLEPAGGRLVFSAPVGIDEGWTVEQKHGLVARCVPLMRRLGLGSRVAVMSGGRSDDMGRNGVVDRTISDALELVRTLRSEGYDAYHAEILVESAMREADLVVAPDGISGNLIFRALHFMGGAKALGAPVVNAPEVFVDTSRAKEDYSDSIALAMRLVETE